MHGSHRQPLGNRNELRRHLCVQKSRFHFDFGQEIQSYSATIDNRGYKPEKIRAFVSQYGELRKVDPPAVGPRDSVL